MKVVIYRFVVSFKIPDPLLEFLRSAYFHEDFATYSPKAVRFHLGYSKDPLEIDDEEADEFMVPKEYHEEMFVWSYSSPEFAMAQVNFYRFLHFRPLFDFMQKMFHFSCRFSF